MQFYTNAFNYGNRIFIRGYDKTGAFISKEEYKPTLFINAKGKSDYKLLNGMPVDLYKPGTIKESKEFIERYKEVESFNVYGQTNFTFQFLSDHYPGEIQYDISKIRVHIWDIETQSEYGFPEVGACAETILLIAIHDSYTKNIIQFGVKEFNGPLEQDVKYITCSDEADLLRKFLEWHQNNYPDVITGWYSNYFDIPYVGRRIEKILGEIAMKRLSPFGLVRNQEKLYQGEMEYSTEISGISLIDYLDLYKKFTFEPRENYRLDTIAEAELGENKLDNPYSTFKDFYTLAWDQFVSYNAHDTRLVHQLENKLKLLDVLFTIAYVAKINYEDVFSPVKTWDTIVYNYLKERNIVIPEQKYHSRGQFEGAYVKEPIKGLYNWVMSFDLQSLYPHLIMQYALSPENILEGKKEVDLEDLVNKTVDNSDLINKNVAMTANGYFFKRGDGGLFPDLMDSMYELRAKAKKQMLKLKQEHENNPTTELSNKISSLNNLQMAAKILLNSAYGGLGSPYFRYYDIRIAEAITLSAQLSVKWMERKFNEFLNKIMVTNNIDYVLYVDTDSAYLNLDLLVKKHCKDKTEEQTVDFLNKFANEILQPFINKCYEELAEYMNADKQKMFMKREAICNKGIWVGKKKYLLNVWDNEGVRYKEAKMKFVGLQIVQSSTPAVVKKQLKDSINIIVNGNEDQLHKFIVEKEKEFKEFSVEDISKPSSVSGLKTYSDSKTIYGKKCPIYVRASLLYNYYLKQYNITNKYELIRDNDKIKYIYLKEPNIIKEDVIGYINTLPKEFNLHNVIDYDKQFETVYLKPIEGILEVIGWTSEPSNSLADMF